MTIRERMPWDRLPFDGDAVELLDLDTGELREGVIEPDFPGREFRQRCDSLEGLWQKAAAELYVEDRPRPVFSASGTALQWNIAADCMRPTKAVLTERPKWGASEGRQATLRTRCKRCDACKRAKRRRFTHAACAEMGAAFAAGGGERALRGARTWFVTLTWGHENRPRLTARAERMATQAAAEAREQLRQIAERAERVQAAEQASGKLAELFIPDDVAAYRADPDGYARMVHRRLHAPMNGERDSELRRHWMRRAAEKDASDFFRRLRRSRARGMGQVPLRAAYAVEEHRDGFPHVHALVIEQGVPLTREAIRHAWRRRADGAESGGARPGDATVPIGAARNVRPVDPGEGFRRSAYYVAKYVAKEGARMHVSRGWGADPVGRAASIAAALQESDARRESIAKHARNEPAKAGIGPVPLSSDSRRARGQCSCPPRERVQRSKATECADAQAEATQGATTASEASASPTAATGMEDTEWPKGANSALAPHWANAPSEAPHVTGRAPRSGRALTATAQRQSAWVSRFGGRPGHARFPRQR